VIGRIADKEHDATFESRRGKSFGTVHWSRSSLVALIILFLTFVAVQKFDVAPQWASISAIVGLVVASLWLV
jgi:hypothetical protein